MDDDSKLSNQSSAEVMTVLGPVPAERLGITLLHEHLVWDLQFGNPDENRYMDDPGPAVEDMHRLFAAGGRTLVEQTNQGVGRNVRQLEQIARQCEVNIIASTGFYRPHTYPSYVTDESAEMLAQRLIRDITVGIDGTESGNG